MDYIKDREIRKLEKKLDKKHFNPDNMVIGYQYRPPLEVLRTGEKREFNRIKEDMLIDSMVRSYGVIYGGVRLEVSDEDWLNFKQSILDYFMSINRPFEYSKEVLKIVDDLFARPGIKTVNINDLLDNIEVLSEDGYSPKDLYQIKQTIIGKVGHKIINLDSYKRR